MVTIHGSKLLPDLPETAPELLWDGLKRLSEQLAKQILDLPTTSPVMISGDWGSGKTTLLKAIQTKLDKGGTPTVWFEAWRYEGESLLLPALMRALWDQAPKKPTLELRNRLWNSAVAVTTGIGPTLAAALGGPAALGFQALLALREEEKAPAPGPPEDTTKQLWNSFRELLEKLWEDRQVVIFIDDLDRCSPQGAVDLLEAIRMLIGQATGPAFDNAGPNCSFVAALDRSVLAEAVANKFADISRYEGNRYLEKVFPIAFDLPQPEGTAIHQFVNLFLKKASEVGSREEDPNYLDALSVALSEPIFANPRLMKRCINRFYTVMRFERADDASRADGLSETSDPEEEAKQQLTLAKWIVASERWPHLRRLLGRQDDEYWHQIRQFLIRSDQELPDADASKLLGERGIKTWLRRELLSGKGTHLIEYRVADRMLRKWGL